MLSKKLFNNDTQLTDYSNKVWRVVETQETAATLHIVDNMEEQGVLEALLDEIKPAYRKGTEGMHYLLKTAFRYPPLKYGSRFGTRLLPSFFYASLTVQGALAETAYYRFVFLDDMQTPFDQSVDSKHSAFNVSIKSDKCLDLCTAAFSSIKQNLTHPSDYRYCQAVGDWAINKRNAEIIQFESSRQADSFNVAVAEPSSIRSRAPNSLQTWLCRTNKERISFSSREAKFPIFFSLQSFLIDGVLPRPA